MALWNKQEPLPASSGAGTVSPPALPPALKHEERPGMSTMAREEVPASSGGASDLLLGAGPEFEGKLTFKGDRPHRRPSLSAQS